jgi:hypothetical protein
MEVGGGVHRKNSSIGGAKIHVQRRNSHIPSNHSSTSLHSYNNPSFSNPRMRKEVNGGDNSDIIQKRKRTSGKGSE